MVILEEYHDAGFVYYRKADIISVDAIFSDGTVERYIEGKTAEILVAEINDGTTRLHARSLPSGEMVIILGAQLKLVCAKENEEKKP